jgi:hypothetical protein
MTCACQSTHFTLALFKESLTLKSAPFNVKSTAFAKLAEQKPNTLHDDVVEKAC